MATATSRKSHSVSTGSTEELRARHAALSLAQVRGDVSSETDAELASIEDALAERDAGSHRAERRAEAAKLEESRLADQARADAAEARRAAGEAEFEQLAGLADERAEAVEQAVSALRVATFEMRQWGADVLGAAQKLARPGNLTFAHSPTRNLDEWIEARVNPHSVDHHHRGPLAGGVTASIEHLRRSVATGRDYTPKAAPPAAAAPPRPARVVVPNGVHTPESWAAAVDFARRKNDPGYRPQRDWEDAVAEFRATHAAARAEAVSTDE